MPIIFNPTGPLDIATDPSDLPEKAEGKVAVSGAMTRCTNLHLDKSGIASTRRGSRRLNASGLGAISRIIEEGGVRYSFVGPTIYADEVLIDSSRANRNWSAVLYNPYNQLTQAVYALNGTDRIKIEGTTVYEWGIAAPTIAPICTKGSYYACTTAADQTSLNSSNWLFTQIANDGSYVTFNWELAQVLGNDSFFPETYNYISSHDFETQDSYSTAGRYEVVYTYARYDSDGVMIAESDPSPAAVTQIESALSVTWVASSDAQVTHVRIYRSIIDTSGQWLYAGVYAVADLTATIFLADDELGTAVEITHDRPPLGTQVVGPSFGGQLFILKDNLLYYSLPLQPEYWPPTYYLEVTPPQFPLMAGCFFGGNLMVASEHEIFLVSGTSAASYFAQPMSAVCGTVARNCFAPVKGHGVFHLGNDGVYLYSAGKDQNITDSRFKPIFEGQTVGSIPGINKGSISNSLMLVKDNKLWFGYPAGNESFCKDFLVMDLENGNIVHYQYAAAMKAIAIDYANDQILAGDSSGYAWVLDDLAQTTDHSTAISWHLESKAYSQFPKYFPRYCRWDVNLTNGATANGYLLLNSEVKQTHPITASRQTRKRHVATCTGTRMSVRVSGTGPVDIYGVEVE